MDKLKAHDIRNSTTAKWNSPTADEFKYGFPSHCLSSISYKWWDNKREISQQIISIDTKETSKPSKSLGDDDGKSSSVDDKLSEINTSSTDANFRWTSSLSDLRKRAAEDGRKALKLGVYKGYGVKNLDRAKKMVLVQIFKSQLPGDCEDLSCES